MKSMDFAVQDQSRNMTVQVKYGEIKLCPVDHSRRIARFQALQTESGKGCIACKIWQVGICLIVPEDELLDTDFYWCFGTWSKMMFLGGPGLTLELFTTSSKSSNDGTRTSRKAAKSSYRGSTSAMASSPKHCHDSHRRYCSSFKLRKHSRVAE
jgi:hypothetical protein